ncbi:MAG TPA: TonB-dependent receptor [Terriglobales bacterium]|nr:TonB-dependent receptor [Terriglobales bacterium]
MECALRKAMTRFLLVFTVLGLLAGTMWAQGGTGELTGLVTDPSGAVIANAQVTLTNSATGETRTTVTTAAGTYRFPALPVVGTYTLETSPKGFRGAKVANIVVSVGTIVNQDVKLELGTSAEQVTVEAGVQQVQTTESSISDLVDRRVWQQMPLETRDQNNFINLLAGAAQGNIALSNLNGGTDRGAAVNGTRSGTGNYLVEGFDNNDQGLGGGGSIGASTGGANTTISPDAIQEYRVISHNFAAEYGMAGGFVTDTVLKSGTNNWHGSLFEYNRVQALAANSFFSNRNHVQDSLVRNQFGGSIGGPIIKDKTFFYFTTEFRRDRSSNPLTGTGVTPDFLNFYNSGGFETFMETDPAGFCNALLGGSCPGAFSNEATLGPIANSLLSSQPLALCTPGARNCTALTNSGALGGGLYVGGLTYPVPVFGTVTEGQRTTFDQARYTAKIDHRIGNNDSLNGSFLYDNGDTVQQWAGGDSTFGPDLPNHARAMNAGITWSHTFTPTVLNQARVSYTRHTANFPGSAAQNSGKIPSIITFFDPWNQSLGNASNLPQFFTENRFEYRDDLSVTHGKHNFKAGAEYSRTRNGSSFEADLNGQFYAYGLLDILSDFKFGHDSDLAAFGYPYYGSWYYAQTTINPTVTPAVRPVYYRGFRANEFAAYFQDDWRIHPRLTLNLGVRWDYFGPPHNFISGLDSNYFSGSPVEPTCTVKDPLNPTTTASGPCNIQNQYYPVGNPTLQAFASGGLAVRNAQIWNKDTNNFAPRIGFSYDVTGRQKLVVRGGFGIAYDRMYNNIFENIRFNPPFFCFCATGAFRTGVPGDAITQAGLYTVPFQDSSVGLFNSPTLFPTGLPKTSPRAIDQNLVTAYYEQTNFGFQYEVAKDLIWETNYVGTFGRKLIGIKNLNTFPGRTAGGSNPDNPFVGNGATNSTKRPNTNVSNINLRTNGFDSNYHALQTSLRKRFANGLSFDANYTYSKALDQISDTFTPRAVNATINPTDSLHPRLDYGPADFNIKHRFVVSSSYDLPFFKTNRWIGGWSVSGIVTAQSGVPFSVFDGAFDANHNGTFNDRAQAVITHGFYTNTSPANGYINVGTPTSPTFQDLTCAAAPLCQGVADGQLPRGVFTGPKYVDVDLSVAKRFKITESAGLTLQGSFFNLFNHPNFAIPDQNLVDRLIDPQTGLFTGNFGKSTSTFTPGQGGARVTQIALRFDF